VPVDIEVRRAAFEIVADSLKQVPGNAIGEFFVDRTCIACETCAQLAPEIFEEAVVFFRVRRQPAAQREIRCAMRALLACPVGAIGTLHRNRAKAVIDDFPLQINGPVYYCGFNSRKSFGANSYFVAHPNGNWLVDSPRFILHLVRRLEAMGGIRYIFLTHQDDVADAARFASHFGAARIIHRADLSAQPDAEIVLDSAAPAEIEPGFRIIPTPGHTRGHSVMLHDERFLFSGDHLWWEPEVKRLGASRSACWYSWPAQAASMRRLLDETFEWLLPGHGDRCHLPAAVMLKELAFLVDRMCA
jgi:glyoxylase-like metal-dependent hydrolase (beta-lactamase superfamily II)/ferredoxin